MSRYIDANTLKSEFEWLLSQVSEISKGEVREVITRIDNTPTANVVEVVQGKWVTTQIAAGLPWKYRCSNCGCPQEYAHNYCPNCGAKMDEEEKK